MNFDCGFGPFENKIHPHPSSSKFPHNIYKQTKVSHTNSNFLVSAYEMCQRTSICPHDRCLHCFSGRGQRIRRGKFLNTAEYFSTILVQKSFSNSVIIQFLDPTCYRSSETHISENSFSFFILFLQLFIKNLRN